MKTMQEYAREYQKTHMGKEVVSDVGEYSFKVTTVPKKEKEEPKSFYIMKSYFWEKEQH